MDKNGPFLNEGVKSGKIWTHYRGGGGLPLGTKTPPSGPFFGPKFQNDPKPYKFWAGRAPAVENKPVSK